MAHEAVESDVSAVELHIAAYAYSTPYFNLSIWPYGLKMDDG